MEGDGLNSHQLSPEAGGSGMLRVSQSDEKEWLELSRASQSRGLDHRVAR